MPEPSLGDFFDRQHADQSESLPLGIQYAQGPEARGLRGAAPSAWAEKWGHPLNGIDLRCVPPELRCPEVWELLSRILEKTFRDISLTARPPSHIVPPFSTMYGGRIHLLGTGNVIGAGVYAPVITGAQSADQNRGVLETLGIRAESEAALADCEFRLTVGGNPVTPYSDFRCFAFPFSPMQPFPVPIPLGPSSTDILLECASISGAAHSIIAQIGGWSYPTRVEVGDNVKSTIVD